ncbi:hypothetical protein ACHHYP_05399 [Achlya hypogyna]|uniref:PX domain-containing protein n=1 Tax=Achlya hypogyna TaxID=1202772 RepID=A0A1V9ZNT4_ACHHY|nr:hypothetical protein ACHHYP_05399 [Achlya hypogyna]
MTSQAQWTYTLRQCDSDDTTKLYCFSLSTASGDVSWTVTKSVVELRYLRQTLETLYRNEVLNGNEASHWTRELRRLLRLPFPIADWLPWTPKQMERTMGALLAFYEDAAAEGQTSFLLHVLRGLLRVFLAMPVHPERHSTRFSTLSNVNTHAPLCAIPATKVL